jgi:hypothetical protein
MNPTLTEEDVRKIIREELDEFLASDRYIFSKTVQFLDGRNIEFSGVTGTKLGTTANHKIGMWGVSPVVQFQPVGQTAGFTQVGTVAATDVYSDSIFTGGTGSQVYTIGDIVRALKLAGTVLA